MSNGIQIKQIKDKQNAIIDGTDPSRIAMFPEGTQTNNRGLIKFMKGAFNNLTSVKPFLIKYENVFMMPTFENIPVFFGFVILLSCPYQVL